MWSSYYVGFTEQDPAIYSLWLVNEVHEALVLVQYTPATATTEH